LIDSSESSPLFKSLLRSVSVLLSKSLTISTTEYQTMYIIIVTKSAMICNEM